MQCVSLSRCSSRGRSFAYITCCISSQRAWTYDPETNTYSFSIRTEKHRTETHIDRQTELYWNDDLCFPYSTSKTTYIAIDTSHIQFSCTVSINIIILHVTFSKNSHVFLISHFVQFLSLCVQLSCFLHLRTTSLHRV